MEATAVDVHEAECATVDIGEKRDTNPLHVDLSEMRTLLFDCDDTLYPRSSGVDVQVRENIGLYMQKKLGIPAEEVPQLRQDLYVKFGTTLRGLQEEYDVDPNDYWTFVHGTLDYERFLIPNPALAKTLKSLPQKKWVFTNANIEHAEACLKRLGLDDGIFEGIIDVRAMDFANKPSAKAFDFMLKITREADPSKIVFFDDSGSNLAGARKYSIHTVHVSPGSHPSVLDVAQLDAVDDLPQVLPDLWKYSPEI